jgi:hypothetical protein
MTIRVVLGGRCGVQAGRILEFPTDAIVSSAGRTAIGDLSANDLVTAMQTRWPSNATDGIDFEHTTLNVLHNGRLLSGKAPIGLAHGVGDVVNLHLVFRSKEHIAAAEKRKAEEHTETKGAPQQRTTDQQRQRARESDSGCCVVT